MPIDDFPPCGVFVASCPVSGVVPLPRRRGRPAFDHLRRQDQVDAFLPHYLLALSAKSEATSRVLTVAVSSTTATNYPNG